MSLITFIVLTIVAVLANDFFSAERKADKKVKSEVLRKIPPAYWSYKTVVDVLIGDE